MISVVLTGTYSWALTVLPPVAEAGPLSPTGVCAGLAIVSLLASPLLPPGRWALVASLDVFVGACLLAWFFSMNSAVEPPFAVFGSFGWLAYTLALGSLSTPPRAAEPPASGPVLEPRTKPSRLSAVALAVCVGLSFLLMGAAWKVERPAVAVLAQVFALTAVLVLLRSGAHLSTYLQVRGTKLSTAPRVRAGVWWLLILALLGVGGALWAWATG